MTDEPGTRVEGSPAAHDPPCGDEPLLSYRGLEVAISGRLASMSRREAIDRLRAAGARWVRAPGPATDVLVVGGGGWPLARDGRPRRVLERARELERAGARLRSIDEERWLGELGLAERESSIRRLCTSAEISRILGVPLARIRGWSRAGLIRAARTLHRLEYYEFREVAAAKSLADLVEAGISPARIRRSLERIRGWLPGAADSLAARALLGESGELLLRLEGGELAEPTGQLRLDFAAAWREEEPFLLRTPRQWCAEAQRLEDAGDLSAASRAYHEALAADPHLAEARFGLANVLYLLENAAEAAAEYLRAVELDPDYVEAWNNLGNAFAELGEVDAAVRAYRRALVIVPDYGDAHFNLAETLWSDGSLDPARAHYAIYLESEPTSPWAKHARERVAGPTT